MITYLDKTISLTPAVKRVVCNKATEYPHTGVYNALVSSGTYLCRRCGLALFRGQNQFHAGCGWPSFDEELPSAVSREPDADGVRTEILCARCSAHLGHVFYGELLTEKNLRHCVNSVSLDYVNNSEVKDTEEAIVAGGCFWGVEYYLQQIPGVLKVESGYTGGLIENPTYEQVCQGRSGHYEAVRVVYDKQLIDYNGILKNFFEIHDPTQTTGQGPDVGLQYQSAIFYFNQQQQSEAQRLIHQLQHSGYLIATRVLAAQVFWPAEEYHQNYYTKHPKVPYCHRRVKRFAD